MVSIVVSSYKEQYFTSFETNVGKTIGLPYEIIKIDNPGLMGICEAYNKGARMAKYEILCFAHEDIEMVTPDWGRIIQRYFEQDTNLGVVGIAGSQYKSFAPSGWQPGMGDDFIHCNLLQAYTYSEKDTELIYMNPSKEKFPKVVCVDGVWFCTKKSIVLEHPFDEDTFQNFHCYDLDFSLSLFGKYDLRVTYDVLLKHYSEGNYGNPLWVEESIKLYRKWQHKAPFQIVSVPPKKSRSVELATFIGFISMMRHSKYSHRKIRQSLATRQFFKTLDLKNILKVYRSMISL
ncbi:MAG: hypothetical protein EOO10_05855 [Chitinophagaceae bacterium]|nr:MAG: hypothetical protein EOO10_05855 [Chitinophagaceae bacterium]